MSAAADETSADTTPAEGTNRVLATWNFVCVDATDEEEAKRLEERLQADGFRVHRGVHRVVTDDNGKTYRFDRKRF